MSIFSLTNCCIGFERRFNDMENFPVKTILLCINITLSRTSQTHPIATSNGKQPIEDREVTLVCTNESSKCRKIAKKLWNNTITLIYRSVRALEKFRRRYGCQTASICCTERARSVGQDDRLTITHNFDVCSRVASGAD